MKERQGRGGNMRRKWKIHNKIGWQIMLLILFTIILPSVFFFWFMVNRYSNDLISQAIDERVSLLQEINKSISLQFSGFRELSMTIYYDNSTRTYIDSRDYTEPPAAVDEALTTILNTRPYVDSLILCFGERVYCYGRNFTNLRQYREKYETQVLEKEGKTVWLPTEIMHGSYSRKPRDFALARAINAPDGQVGVFYMFCSSDFFGKIYSNPILTEGSSHYYLLDPDGQVVMSDLTASVGSGSTLTFTADALKDQKGSLTVDGTDGNAQIASYARMDGTGWVSVIVAERSELTANARSLRRLSDVFSLFYLLVMVAGYGAIYGFIIRPLGSLSGGMEKVARGEFHELQSPPGQNEIKQLTESYNVMVVQIQTLLQQVRAEEAEKNEQRIKVLYMQIGPHFLYNTLNSIKWMAVLKATPHNGKKIHAICPYRQAAWKIPVISLRGQPKSDCQTRSVSQNQICQRKHHIQFGGLFFQSSVSCFSVSQQTLHNGKNVFYFCPDGRFFMFSAFELGFRSGGILFNL
jgi:two-component system, sensor histidine kinase YesM